MVSDQKNGDAVFDAIVNNVLKNDILARNTLWQDACYDGGVVELERRAKSSGGEDGEGDGFRSRGRCSDFRF